VSQLAKSKARTALAVAFLLLHLPIRVVMEYSLNESRGVTSPAISDIQDEVAAQHILGTRKSWAFLGLPKTPPVTIPTASPANGHAACTSFCSREENNPLFLPDPLRSGPNVTRAPPLLTPDIR
jgi:hypothetical protein